jgi:predicted adenine nucleotide alpha hydrolase (AANH) superfamily ATPase
MVAHLCCSVDAGYFLKRLKEEFPGEKIVGYFYDPNIHPYSEFKLRSLDTKRICKRLGIEYVEGEYDYLTWYQKTKGLEEEREKGIRCSVCFDLSLEKSAEFAKKIGDNKVTTSLLMSPMKSHKQLEAVGKVIKRKYGVEFVNVDYRKRGGTQAQQEFAKENQLYRQDYCGCLYGIWQQKSNQEIIDELISPFPFQILPSSIEEKLEFYEKRVELEEKGIEYKILKEKFLNYRLLQSSIKVKKNPLPHYTLFYSYLDRPQRVRIEFQKDGIGYANRAEVIFVKLDKLNEILNKEYKSIAELFKKPLLLEDELKVREKITKNKYNLSPIIVLEKFEDIRYDIDINSKIYPDTKEILIKF